MSKKPFVNVFLCAAALLVVGLPTVRGRGVTNEFQTGFAPSGQKISHAETPYDTGFRLGRDDSRAGRGKDYKRHRNAYDSRDESEFRRGYNDGYERKIEQYDPQGSRNPVYDDGFRQGKEDYKAGLSRNYKRHKDTYTSRTESDFRDGYNAGYDKKIEKNEGMLKGEKEAYDEGYRLGQDDKRDGRGRDYRRYRDRYDRDSESFFKQGYEAGYAARKLDVDSGTTGSGQSAYNDGFKLGQQDVRDGLHNDYRRYRDRYDSRTEAAFRRGYDEGYAKATSEYEQTVTQQAYYDGGYWHGQQDSRNGLSRDYRRHQRVVDPTYESWFKKGYEDGYANRNNQGGMRPEEKRWYDEGFQRGRADNRSGFAADYRRHRFDSRYETFFRRGYKDGYERKPELFEAIIPNDQSFYDEGYKLGRKDARNGLGRDYKRYKDRYDSSTEPLFRRGYDDGYRKQ